MQFIDWEIGDISVFPYKGYSIWKPKGGTEGKILLTPPHIFLFFSLTPPHMFYIFHRPPPSHMAGGQGKTIKCMGGRLRKNKMGGGASEIFSSPSPPKDFKWNSP